MPVYILLLIALAPVLAMVATAGNAFGHDAQLAAVIALTIILSAVVAWLVVRTVRTVLGTWRRVKPSLTRSDTNIFRSAERRREVTRSAR
jgi:peptidoglycan/LPS O-acetylase OafA/YrhL